MTTETKIYQLEYKGQNIPIRIGYWAMKQLKIETGKDFAEISSNDFDLFETFLWYCLVRGYKELEQPIPFKREQMEDIMDEVYFSFMQLIPIALAANQTSKTDSKQTDTTKKNPPKPKK